MKAIKGLPKFLCMKGNNEIQSLISVNQFQLKCDRAIKSNKPFLIYNKAH